MQQLLVVTKHLEIKLWIKTESRYLSLKPDVNKMANCLRCRRIAIAAEVQSNRRTQRGILIEFYET